MSADVLAFAPRRCVVITGAKILRSTDPDAIGQPFFIVSYIHADGSEGPGLVEFSKRDAERSAVALAAHHRCRVQDRTAPQNTPPRDPAGGDVIVYIDEHQRWCVEDIPPNDASRGLICFERRADAVSYGEQLAKRLNYRLTLTGIAS